MADIQDKIRSKYGIDITQENIFKLYKIDNPDVTSQELQILIDATRKRWNQSINEANEKNATRDRARMEKADRYEEILRDDKLRKELFSFYSGENTSSTSVYDDGVDLNFAREYFKLIETSKKIRKSDVEFFFNYYQAECKNKKAILEMLGKEFKINGLGKEGSYVEEDKEVDLEGKTKDPKSPLIVNFFQEATVIKLRKCVDFYENSMQSNDVCQRYPAIRGGLYDFLELNCIDTIQQFTEFISAKSKEVYLARQEWGTEFVSLVDLFNTLQTLSEYRDVVDNFAEFKLLIRYPNLTPYMYSLTEMKKSTLTGMIEIANRDYFFRDETDFILNYYIPVHDNFGITNSGIIDLIKTAEKSTKSNEVLNEIDEKLGRKKKRRVPVSVDIVHWLVYWPIFLVYLIFEMFKTIFSGLRILTIPGFLALFIGEIWLFPSLNIVDSPEELLKIFSKQEWYTFIRDVMGDSVDNGFDAVIMSLIVIIPRLTIYILPALFGAMFIANTARELNERYDWIGYQRTFNKIIQTVRNNTEAQYIGEKKRFIRKKIPHIILNVVCLGIVFLAIYLVR